MRCLFKDNRPLTEFVLRILTDKADLVITDWETQKDMKRLTGARSVCLDAYGTDSSGKKYNLEIQRQDRGSGSCRARYHSGILDVENLHQGQDFRELPDTYVIFVTEKDIYGMGVPFYPVERVNLVTNCTKADDMQFELMAERTRYLKEDPEGVSEMCKILEDMRNESLEKGIREGTINTAKRMLKVGKYALEEIANISGRSLDEVKRLKAGQTI